MLKITARHVKINIFAALALAVALFCAPGPALAGEPAGAPYAVRLENYPDNYILTQLFYSAFSAENLAAVQYVASQAMLTFPEDFPRYMALTLELLKTPDSRLFMLLAPLAPHVADESQPVDLKNLMRLTNILSGKAGPEEAEPSLVSHIRFYDDEAAPPLALSPEEKLMEEQLLGGGQNSGYRPTPPAPPVAEVTVLPGGPSRPVRIAGAGESFSFARNTPGANSTESKWTYAENGPHGRSSRSLSAVLPDGSVWGGVYTDVSGRREKELAFFLVRGGIISFALPAAIDEGEFYADGEARPHRLETGLAPRPGVPELLPCEMQVILSLRDDGLPPELSARLEQTNAGPESGYICRPQCALSYSWGLDGYVLSGKSCVESGWGVWPWRGEAGRLPENTPSRSTP